MNERTGSGKSADAYRTIGEVAEELKLPQHVLRFWETRFPQVKPLKRAGGRRFYRPDDVALLRAIKAMLYGQGYTIKGVQRLLQDQGPRSVAASATMSAAVAVSGAASPDAPARPPSDAAVVAAALRGPEPAAPQRDAEPLPRSIPPRRVEPAQASLGALLERLDTLARDLAECRRILGAARAIDDRQ